MRLAYLGPVSLLIAALPLAACTSAASAVGGSSSTGSLPLPSPVSPPADSGFVASGPYSASASGAPGGAPATSVSLADGGTGYTVKFGGSVASATPDATYWQTTVWLASASDAAPGTYTNAALVPQSATFSVYSEDALLYSNIPDGGDQSITFTLISSPQPPVESGTTLFHGTFSATFDLRDANKNPVGEENIAETF